MPTTAGALRAKFQLVRGNRQCPSTWDYTSSCTSVPTPACPCPGITKILQKYGPNTKCLLDAMLIVSMTMRPNV